MFKATLFLKPFTGLIYTRFHIHILIEVLKASLSPHKEAFRTSIDQRAGRTVSLDPDMAVSADE